MRLIDGDALTDAFYQKMKELLKSTDTPQICKEALSLLCGASLIRKAPTITPTIEGRKKGKWIAQYEEGMLFPWWKCSCCGQLIYSETERDRIDFHAYCGRCGADMRGEKDETD